MTAYGNALDAESMGTTDIAYGHGVRYALGKHEMGQQATLELFAARRRSSHAPDRRGPGDALSSGDVTDRNAGWPRLRSPNAESLAGCG